MQLPAAGRTLNIALWIAQCLLAVVFLTTGYVKLIQPINVLAETYRWVAYAPPILVRLIGFSELLAVAGLLGPSATRILPQLTVFAAMGIIIIMVGAIITHTLLMEPFTVIVNVVLLSLAILVAYGRSVWRPISPRMDTAT